MVNEAELYEAGLVANNAAPVKGSCRIRFGPKGSGTVNESKADGRNVGRRWSGESVGIFLLGVASLLCILRLVGCGTSTPPTAGDEVGLPPRTQAAGEAADILKNMIANYKSAKAYRDQGQVRLSFNRNGQRTEQSWNCAVQFVRPGRLRVDAFHLTLVSDAQSPDRLLQAKVADAESNNIDNQWVARLAPAEISLETLAADPILFSQLTGRFQRPPVQLELLLTSNPLATLFQSEVPLNLLPEKAIADRLCYCVEAKAAEGTFTFWIDHETWLLRRLEYPAKALLPDLAADPQVTDAALSVDLVDATFSPLADALDFAFEIPSGGRRVRAFVPPPVSSHAEILGKPLPAFEFIQLDGKRLNAASLSEKVTALFWYAHHPVCETPLKQFAEIAEQLGDRVAAFAICTEPVDVGDKEVREQLAAWKVAITPARDLKEYRSRVFQVRDLPAITLIDAAGRLQWIESGPAAVNGFPKAMERLVNGANLAEESKTQQQLLVEQYERLIAAGGPQIDTGLAPPSPAGKLTLHKQWQLHDFQNPVGLLAIDNGTEAARLLVVDHRGDANLVCEVSAGGNLLATHALQLPQAQPCRRSDRWLIVKGGGTTRASRPTSRACNISTANGSIASRIPRRKPIRST